MTARRALSLLLLLNLLAVGVGLYLIHADPMLTGMRTVAAAFDLVEKQYAEKIDPDSLFFSSVEGIKQKLDPFTGYVPAADYHYFEEENEGEFYGIGVEITVVDGLVTVVSALEGSPAQSAGLRAGDQVTAIDDVAAHTLDPDRAIALIRGRPGTQVKLKIRRPGLQGEFNVVIKREAIRVSSIDFAGATDSIGYIRLTRFALNSLAEFVGALDSLQGLGIKGLIVDLRGNPGGLLEAAVALTGLFLPKDELIVSTRGRSLSESLPIRNFEQPRYPVLPLALLVDRGSASASEIMSGALQDHDRAVVIGDTTFGKGLVQSVTPLPDGGALRLTVSKYYLPSGRTIQKFTGLAQLEELDTQSRKVGETYSTAGGRAVHGGGGVAPDICLPEPPTTLLEAELGYGGYYFDFAVDYARQHDLLHGWPAPDSLLAQFRSYLRGRGFAMSNAAVDALDGLLDAARADSAGPTLISEAQQLQRALRSTEGDLWERSRAGIYENLLRALSNVALPKRERYLKYDLLSSPIIAAARETLLNPARYRQLLAIPPP